MKQIKMIIVLISFGLITSFVIAPKDKEQLIQESLEKRIEKYKMEQLDKCYKKAMLEAEAAVDSIIAIELGAGPIDTLDFPRKPQKPAFEPYDSLKQNGQLIKPLFENPEINRK